MLFGSVEKPPRLSEFERIRKRFRGSYGKARKKSEDW